MSFATRLRPAIPLAFAAALVWSAAPPAGADVADEWAKLVEQYREQLVDEPVYEGPRVVAAEAGGMPFKVLLPTGYATSGKRYPVLYLMHPAFATDDAWLNHSDLVEFTAKSDTIVVLPDQRVTGFAADGLDGRCQGETRLIGAVLPYVDAHFRTVADGRHRAIAGSSSGAFSALYLAARNPDRFVAAASIDGPPSPSLNLGRVGMLGFVPFERGASVDCGSLPTAPGMLGDPVREELWWRDADAADLAANLRATTLYLSVGNGVPCDAEDVAGLSEAEQSALPGAQAGQLFEALEYGSTHGLAAALDASGVQYTANIDGCGLHNYRYWQRGLREFWPLMQAAFGQPAPAAFDLKRAVPSFSAWGWTFMADPARAPEFLSARQVSRDGFTLTGSGTTSVTTAALFHPSQQVRVGDGLSSRTLRADADGRLSLTVDLGAPHTIQQYRDENLAAPLPGYFTTRTLTLAAMP